MTDKLNMAQAINLALRDAMAADDTVLVLGEDVGDTEGGGVVGLTKGLSTTFGSDRVRSTPIAEQAIIGAAIGAAMIGFKPVAEIMLMNFMTVASDMVVNHAAKLRFMSGGQTAVPITIRTMTGAGVSNGGQHSDFLEAWFAHTAGLKVVVPSSASDAYGLLRACIDDPDPCIFVETMPALFDAAEPFEPEIVPLSKARVLRSGSDVSVIGYGRVIQSAAAIADKLANEGISAEVIDLRTVAPYDQQAVRNSVAKTGAALIVHEAVRNFGPGAEIAAMINEHLFGRLRAPARRLGAAFAPVPFSKPLETASLPTAVEIEEAIRELTATKEPALPA